MPATFSFSPRKHKGLRRKHRTIRSISVFILAALLSIWWRFYHYTSHARTSVVVIDHAEWLQLPFDANSLHLPSLARANNPDRAWDESCVQWIDEQKIRRVVFNGFPPSACVLARMLQNRDIQVYVVYHGERSERNSSELSNLVTSVEHGVVNKVGVMVNEDAYQLLCKFGLPAERLSYPTVEPRALRGIKFSMLDNKLHIGIFEAIQSTTEKDRVALGSLFAAACSLVLTRPIVLHVFKWSILSNRCPIEVIQHEYGTLAHFKRLVGQMDLTLDVSGNRLVTLISIATGVPCTLVGQIPNIYDAALPELRDLLICPGHGYLQTCLVRLVDYMKGVRVAEQLQMLAAEINNLAQSQIARFLAVDGQYVSDHMGAAEHVPVKIRHPKSFKSPPANKTVVLTTNELAYVTPGGAGTVVHAMASALAYAGVNVIVLADMDVSRLQKYTDVIKDTAIATGRLQAMQLSAYAQEGNHSNTLVRKSIQWADGIEVLLKSVPHVDAVEFVDYTGPAAVLLARRLNGQTRLPHETKIIVRVHGSYEFIDVAERAGYVSEREVMYLMERLAMNAADAVLVPSASLGQLYIDGTHIAPPRMIVAAPPVQESLKQLGVRAGFCRRARGVQSQIYPPDTQGQKFQFLVLGKIQRIKGQMFVVNAASDLLRILPPTDAHRVSISFVGSSVASGDHMADPARELQEAIPLDLMEHFKFRQAVARSDIAHMACSYDAAIIASTFESFNMVAHELHYLGIPIVISDFAGFADFFGSHNAHIFRHGNAASLRHAMRQAMVDSEVAWTPIQYHDPLAAYASVLHDEFLPNQNALDVSAQSAHDLLAALAGKVVVSGL